MTILICMIIFNLGSLVTNIGMFWTDSFVLLLNWSFSFCNISVFCLSLIDGLVSSLSINNSCRDDFSLGFRFVVGLRLGDVIGLDYGFKLGDNFGFIQSVGSVDRDCGSFLKDRNSYSIQYLIANYNLKRKFISGKCFFLLPPINNMKKQKCTDHDFSIFSSCFSDSNRVASGSRSNVWWRRRRWVLRNPRGYCYQRC